MRRRVWALGVMGGVLAAGAGLAWPGPVGASTEAAIQAMQEGDMAGALVEFRAPAEAGDVVAQFNLGLMYEAGMGVAPNLSMAAYWYGMAAARGDSDAQLNLAQLYEEGRGVPHDERIAAEWLRQAAEQDVTEAQRRLAAMYAEGRGVPRDKAAAARWYQLAAEQADARAQTALGLMTMTGDGVKRDPVAAYMWFALAAPSEPAAVGYRDALAERLSPEQRAEGEKRAETWRPRTMALTPTAGLVKPPPPAKPR